MHPEVCPECGQDECWFKDADAEGREHWLGVYIDSHDEAHCGHDGEGGDGA